MYSHALIKWYAFKTHHAFVQGLFYKTLFYLMKIIPYPVLMEDHHKRAMNLDFQSTAATTALYIAYSGQRKLRSFLQTGIKSPN